MGVSLWLVMAPGYTRTTAHSNNRQPVLESVSVLPTSVQCGNTSVGTVTLNGFGASGGTVVSLSSSNAAAAVPSSVTVPSNQTIATFTLSTSGVNSPTTATITASLNGTSVTATLTVTPATLASLSLNPTSVIGGTSLTGAVTLSGPAGPEERLYRWQARHLPPFQAR